jgi:phage tail tube protein FII
VGLKHTQETEHHQEVGIENKLQLNNGAKWKADLTTNGNVHELLDIFEVFHRGSDKSMASYNKTAIDLEHGIDKMIRECRMKGPDHEALHLWLEPLLNKLNEFKNAPTVEEADRLFVVLQSQVNMYSQYFE